MDTFGKLVVGIFALLTGGIVTFLVIRECYTYRRGSSLLDARQFRFRMVLAAILFGLIIMMCAGVYVVDYTGAAMFVAYWFTFALLCLVPVVMSIVDLGRLARVRQEKQFALRKEMAQFVHEQVEILGNQAVAPTEEAEAPPREQQHE